MHQCPVCNEVVEILTNYHCHTKHGMSKKEIVKRYGKPKAIDQKNTRQINEWIRKTSAIVTKEDFGVAQASDRSVKKRRRG